MSLLVSQKEVSLSRPAAMRLTVSRQGIDVNFALDEEENEFQKKSAHRIEFQETTPP